jgi:hypothetical protein
VKNLHTIWGTMASGYAIDGEKFGKLCADTNALYLNDEKTNWYNIPPTIHKVLVHGKDIIEHCPLPIGLTNEEASEANNKILRNVRLHHTRKTSWSDGMSDLYHRMMDLSDPVVLQKSQQKKKKREKKPLSPEILSLLQSPVMQIEEQEDTEDELSDN